MLTSTPRVAIMVIAVGTAAVFQGDAWPQSFTGHADVRSAEPQMPAVKVRYPEAERLIEYLATHMFMPPLSEKCRERRAVPQPLRTALLVIAFDTEFQMEGILGFLENSTGTYLPETIEAFRTIGANHTAELLLEIADIMRAENVTTDQLHRDNAALPLYDISSFRETHGPAAERMAARITALADGFDSEDPLQLLNAYAASHLTELRQLIARYEAVR